MKDWTNLMIVALLIVVAATVLMFWEGNDVQRLELLALFKLIVGFVIGASTAGAVGYAVGFTKGRASSTGGEGF